MPPTTRAPSTILSRQRMRLSVVSASATASLLLAIGLGTSCRRAPPDGIALVGATLIDGSGGPALPDAAIVVRRGRIESVGRGRVHAAGAHRRGGRRPSLDHPGPDRRPRPCLALGAAALSRLGRDHRARPARGPRGHPSLAQAGQSRQRRRPADLQRGRDDRRPPHHVSRRHRREQARGDARKAVDRRLNDGRGRREGVHPRGPALLQGRGGRGGSPST